MSNRLSRHNSSYDYIDILIWVKTKVADNKSHFIFAFGLVYQVGLSYLLGIR